MKRLLHFMMNWPGLLSGISVSKHLSFSIQPAFSCKTIGSPVTPGIPAMESNPKRKRFHVVPLLLFVTISAKQLFPDKRAF
jgi:hypothetical protein